uniref:Homoserine O-acetyltransferase n=1 Tax=uncultured Armatimonadetes bacterium TaxID=157466 RepID=A0A6J4JG55_9BACT|nr:Homoserine O-acetyltransferase [uncultured Armatimonadetes bacterium]
METADVRRREFLVHGGAAAAVGLALLGPSFPAWAFPSRPGEEVVPWADPPPPVAAPQVVPRQLDWERLDSWITPNDRFFVVASNTLGGCRGTTGPSSPDPATGRPYGLTFPIITIRDMVRVQERLLRHLGIEELRLVAGGSMGGMQALEWAVMYPERVRAALPIATTARLSARGIAFNEIARRAICLDPRWNKGDYYGSEDGGPDAGLALARMVGTVTYLSDAVLQEQFGRKPASEESAIERDLHARFDVERYLHDEGEALVRRFDANSYLYLTKACDLHDVSRGYPSLEAALARVTARTLLVAIRSDDLFPPQETDEIVAILRRHNRDVRHFLLDSAYGHDAFLVEQDKMLSVLRDFVAEI